MNREKEWWWIARQRMIVDPPYEGGEVNCDSHDWLRAESHHRQLDGTHCMHEHIPLSTNFQLRLTC